MKPQPTKAKAPGRTLAGWIRMLLLGSESFVMPTHAPYDESLHRLRQALADSPRIIYSERVIPEDDDSAEFEIHFYVQPPSSQRGWRKLAIARGRVVSQPAFGDAMLRGEVFNGWADMAVSYLFMVIGALLTLWFVNALAAPGEQTLEAIEVLCGGGFSLMLVGTGIMRLFDMPVGRRKLLTELAAMFADNRDDGGSIST